MAGAPPRVTSERPGRDNVRGRETTVIAVVPVTVQGNVDPRWGKAARVAVAKVENGEIVDWTEHPVGWDAAHDIGTEGSHHARIVRFLIEHEITHVVVNHMGAPMVNTITKMGLTIVSAASANAREAVALAGEGGIA